MKTESIEYYKYENPNYYKDKGIIITGATGGIGQLLTKTLIELGARVVAVIKNEKKGKEMFESYISNGTLQYQVFDFAREIDYRQTFSDIMMKLGGKLDVMFLCHGSFSHGDIMDTTIREFDELLDEFNDEEGEY